MPSLRSTHIFKSTTAPGTSDCRVRKGFIALGRVEVFIRRRVSPRANVSGAESGPLGAFAAHPKRTRDNCSCFTVTPAARVDALLDAATRGMPEVEVRDEYNVVHRLWPMTDPRLDRDDPARNDG